MTLESIKDSRDLVLREISLLQLSLQHLEYEEKELLKAQQPKLERWKPDEKGRFYWLNSLHEPLEDEWRNNYDISIRWENYNCFPNQEEAQQEALRTRARRKLEWYARELNGKFEGHQDSLYLIDYLNGKFYVMQLGYDWIKHGMVGLITFKCKPDAEYALSQMTDEELEALR